MSAQAKNFNTRNIVIVAGESSGDAHAARLVGELKKLDNNIRFRGMGGEHMRQAGVDVFIDMAKLSVMGIAEVLGKYLLIKAELNRLKENIKKQPPDLLILVDYQEFNQRLAAYARSIGVKVLFYIGPSVWAWRPKRVYKMAKIVDHMAVILPFEKKLYEDAHVPVTFTGHPLKDEVVKDKTRQQARELLNLEDRTTIGLFPGSRSSEIRRILPVLLESAETIRQEERQQGKPGLQFVLPLATTISEEDLAPFAEQLESLQVHCLKQKDSRAFYDIIQACDLILCASGTATLEIGLLEVPMVIVYKTSVLTYHIMKSLAITKFIGLVNIVPNKSVAKEFIQHEATAENISAEALRLLNDQKSYQNMQHELSLLRQQLAGDNGNAGNGSKNVAELAYKMLNHSQLH